MATGGGGVNFAYQCQSCACMWHLAVIIITEHTSAIIVYNVGCCVGCLQCWMLVAVFITPIKPAQHFTRGTNL
jgi:hypothetical protein